jgi:hypothetical protein
MITSVEEGPYGSAPRGIGPMARSDLLLVYVFVVGLTLKRQSRKVPYTDVQL